MKMPSQQWYQAVILALLVVVVASCTNVTASSILQQQLNPAWTAISHLPAVYHRGYIYTASAESATGPSNQWSISKDVGRNWTVVSYTTVPSYGGEMISWENEVMMYAGGNTSSSVLSNTLWASTNSTEWVSYGAQSWPARSKFGMVYKRFPTARVIVFGGIGENGWLRDVWSSTAPLVGASWRCIANAAPWSARGNFAYALTSSDRIVLSGPFDDVWISNVDVSSWDSLPQTPSAWFGGRSGGSLVSANGFLYHFGGRNSTGAATNDVWVSADEGGTWLTVTADGDGASFSQRSEQKVVAAERTIVLMAGRDSNFAYLKDVWSGFV